MAVEKPRWLVQSDVGPSLAQRRIKFRYECASGKIKYGLLFFGGDFAIIF
jgi:hypothetical protein